jgi:hypothetical protein
MPSLKVTFFPGYKRNVFPRAYRTSCMVETGQPMVYATNHLPNHIHAIVQFAYKITREYDMIYGGPGFLAVV